MRLAHSASMAKCYQQPDRQPDQAGEQYRVQFKMDFNEAKAELRNVLGLTP
jgi:hypothetical protein